MAGDTLRARLLDMGEVAPVRSQSLYRAVADTCERPALVVLLPASPLILVGGEAELATAEVESCRARGVPVLPWPAPGVRRLDGRWLVFQLIVPEALAGDLGLPVSGAERQAWLAAKMAAVCGDGDETAALVVAAGRVSSAGREVASVEPFTVGECAVALGDLELSLAMDQGVEPAALAERLVSTFEDSLGLVFEPSMPTPEEMEAIYLHDERLARAERAGLGHPRQPNTAAGVST